MRREPFFTLPNIISMSRFVMAAGFLATRSTDARVALLGAASASDILDGWVARRRAVVTRLGAMLDPVADRTFVLVVVVMFLAQARITRAEYFVLLARDLATAIGFLVARSVPRLRAAPFQARRSGKIVTMLQMVTLLSVLVYPAAVPALVAVVGLASIVAIVDYTRVLWSARH
jgi:phosphatidylglycerophosphate synthase